MICLPNFFGQQTWDTTQTKPLAMSVTSVTPYRCLGGHLQQWKGSNEYEYSYYTTTFHK